MLFYLHIYNFVSIFAVVKESPYPAPIPGPSPLSGGREWQERRSSNPTFDYPKGVQVYEEKVEDSNPLHSETLSPSSRVVRVWMSKPSYSPQGRFHSAIRKPKAPFPLHGEWSGNRSDVECRHLSSRQRMVPLLLKIDPQSQVSGARGILFTYHSLNY